MAGQTRIDGNLIDTGTDPNDIVSVSVGDGRYPRLSQDNTLAGNLTVDGDLNLVATGAGTGVFTIAAPDSNTNRTLTLPDEAGTVLTDVGVPSSAMPAGSVIQVKEVEKNDTFSTTSGSFTDITDLSISITPISASSKIMLLFNGVLGSSRDDRLVLIAPARNGSTLGIADPDEARSQSFTGVHFAYNQLTPPQEVRNVAFQYIDFPSTTSPTTYTVQMKDGIGGDIVYLGRHGAMGGSSDENRGTFSSMFTVMEIKG